MNLRKSVELVTIDREYISDKLMPGASTSKKQAERRENLNE